MLLWRMSLDFCCCFLLPPQRGSTDVHEAMPYYYIWMRNFTSLSVSAFRSSSLVTCQARQWLLPREANFSHMFPAFIPSNGPICLSKSVCCVLFPARFVPMPSLQWAPLSPGGWSRSLTLFIQTEQLGPSQPKQWGMGREIIMETSG